MPVISGNTTGSITGLEFDIPANIKYYVLTNKSGGNITVNLYINSNGVAVHTLPSNLVLSAGDMLVSDDEILLLGGFTINLITSGSLDYYFALD